MPDAKAKIPTPKQTALKVKSNIVITIIMQPFKRENIVSTRFFNET